MTTELTSDEQIGAVHTSSAAQASPSQTADQAAAVQAQRSPYTDDQISVWLRGLLTIAWADGRFSEEEKNLIAEITQNELAPSTDLGPVETIAPTVLAATFGTNTSLTENFLRTAVMVAIADGVYSLAEDEVLHEFCTVLGLDPTILTALRSTLNNHPETDQPPEVKAPREVNAPIGAVAYPVDHEPLKVVQGWLDHLDVKDARLARFLCQMIPPQCPFERDVTLFGRKIVHIPPMCQLNPLYEQLVGLRFRALSYLADDCREDVSRYC
jgi:tellurite resistance protein